MIFSMSNLHASNGYIQFSAVVSDVEAHVGKQLFAPVDLMITTTDHNYG